MMDLEGIGSGLAAIGAATVSKDAIQRILAPTADYIGAGLLSGTKATVNTVRVLARAVIRLGPRIHSDGQVPLRVMKGVLDEAPFCEDELMAEYLGGILASSFGNEGRDDRGVALLATLRRLSTYSIRMHYICYREFAKLVRGPLPQKPVFEEAGLPNTVVAVDLRMFIGFRCFNMLMRIPSTDESRQVYFHASSALERENLIEGGPMGDPSFLAEAIRSNERHAFPDDGFIYERTLPGEELFVWGLGRGSAYKPFGLPDLELEFDVPDVSDCDAGSARLSDLKVGAG